MKENIEHLHERVKHFQSLVAYMSEHEKKYYLEKDWFDTPTLISIEYAKKEVELAKKKLELLSEQSVICQKRICNLCIGTSLTSDNICY